MIDPTKGDPGWPDLFIRDFYTKCDGRTVSGLNREITSGSSVTVALHALENIGKQPAFLPKGLLLIQATENGQPVGAYVVADTHIMKAEKGIHYEFEIPAVKLTRPGAHEIRMMVDPQNAVKENNDNNNPWAFFITVKGPDLAVTSVTAAPADPSTRQSITVKDGQFRASIPPLPVPLPQGARGLMSNGPGNSEHLVQYLSRKQDRSVNGRERLLCYGCRLLCGPGIFHEEHQGNEGKHHQG